VKVVTAITVLPLIVLAHKPPAQCGELTADESVIHLTGLQRRRIAELPSVPSTGA
jgi:hypothetical protein